jgi:hypothetical protein
MTTTQMQEWVDYLVANLEPEETGALAEIMIATVMNAYTTAAMETIYDQLESKGITISTSVAKCKAHPA